VANQKYLGELINKKNYKGLQNMARVHTRQGKQTGIIRAVFPNPVPGGTPTLRVFFVSLIKHT